MPTPTDAPAAPSTVDSVKAKHILSRCDTLAALNERRRNDLWRVRAIVDGGTEGMKALLGRSWQDHPERELSLIPAANHMVSGLDRLAQRTGRLPDLNMEPPQHQDSDAARKRTEKVLRILSAMDEQDRLELALPQASRWLFGYGFVPFVMKGHRCHGAWYPHAELRDPWECDPAPWGPQQQPIDVAFRRIVPAETLIRLYPEYASVIKRSSSAAVPILPSADTDSRAAARLHRGFEGGSWENPSQTGLEVVEYYDADGTWVVLPERMLVLDFSPNPEGLGRGAFVLIKKFSFNELHGIFDHTIGLMSSMAKISVLVTQAIEDSVHTETNVIGERDEIDYQRGRGAVNFLSRETLVQRPYPNFNPAVFNAVGFLERQLRVTSGYDGTLDGDSPTSFITGRGVEELRSGVDAAVREAQLAIKWGLQDLDRMRLDYDEARFDYDKPLVGYRRGDYFEERYTPSKAIRGMRHTRRVYGAMAGFDDPAKVAVGANLVQMGAMSLRTFMENIDGLENVFREEERIKSENASQLLRAGLEAAAQQGDPAALMALIEMMPEGNDKRIMQRFFTPSGDELSPEEEAILNPPPDPARPGMGLPATPPDVATVLARTFGDSAELGVQRVGRVA